jgi:hypothetical protein
MILIKSVRKVSGLVKCLLLVSIPKRRQTRQARSGDKASSYGGAACRGM